MQRLENKIPPAILWLAAATVTWMIDVTDLDGSPLEGPVADVLAIVGVVGGVGLGLAGIVQFSRAGTTVDPHHPDRAVALVTSGVYRFTRNPMYTGMVLILIGWGLRLGTALGLVVGVPLLIGLLTVLQIRAEERTLADRFGAEFEAYRSTVRRWI